MIEFRARYSFTSDAYDFMVLDREYANGSEITKAVARPLIMTTHKLGSAKGYEPTMTLTANELQTLFNELWREGFRPKDGTGGAGQIESIKYHLEDMRKLVFKDGK